jgi:CrcB protein
VGLALAVGGAGALGAVARYLTDLVVQARSRSDFPVATLIVNLAGSFVLGMVAGLALTNAGSATAKAVVGTGFCGGLTTWSTASWVTLRLAQEGDAAAAVRFTLANLFGSLALGGVGLAIFLR